MESVEKNYCAGLSRTDNVAFQRATFDLPGIPTTPGRPRNVQVAPQPLMAPGSPVTPRTGGMLPFLIAV